MITHDQLHSTYTDYIIMHKNKPKTLIVREEDLNELIDSTPFVRQVLGKVKTYMGARILRSYDLEPGEFFWA